MSAKIKQNLLPVILVIFVGIAIALNLRLTLAHEMWRDEAQSWLIARDTTSFSSFIQTLSHEGHPFLWYVFLMPFAKLGFPYIYIKWISFVILTIVILMIAFMSPLHEFCRIAAIYGMCLYWYASFARSYCLAVLLIITLAWQYKKRLIHPFRYCLLIALMIQTHLLLVGFAFALSLAFLLELLFLRRQDQTGKAESFFSVIKRTLPLLLPLLSAFLLLYELHDVSNSSFNSPQSLSLSFYTIKSVGENIHFTWNTLMGFWGSAVLILIIILLWQTLKLHFKELFISLCIMIFGLLFMHVMFAFYVYPLIHRALFVMYLILWGGWVFADLNTSTTDQNNKNWMGAIFGIALLVGGFSCFSLQKETMMQDMAGLFSDAENAAAFLDSLPEDSIIMESSEDYCNSVIPYLHRNVVYNPFSMEVASFMPWDQNKPHQLSWEQFLENCSAMFPDATKIYLLYSRDGNSIEHFPSGLKPLYSSTAYTIYSEYYDVYEIDLG